MLGHQTRDLEVSGSIPGSYTFMHQILAICWHTCDFVAKQYNSLVDGKVTAGLVETKGSLQLGSSHESPGGSSVRWSLLLIFIIQQR